MGNGMADYALNANIAGVNTVKEYELYCHYVAGLVGEGVSRMFILAGLADPVVLERPELSESMAQLLQQTNIIRDVYEDHEQNRHFWPKEIWSRHVDRFDDFFLQDTRSRMKALECSSEMVLLAINRAQECLAYMANVREQSTFNFVAIPQCMAIATLELCFRNPEIFERNVKITKGLACQLLIESTKDIRHVGRVFHRFAKKIQDRNEPDDPNHDKINAACEKICRIVDDLVSDYRIPWIDSSVALSSKGRYIAVWSGVLALGFLTVLAIGFTSLR
ncbi:ERG9, squalene synthase, partial [Aureobasidium melanogenum]